MSMDLATLPGHRSSCTACPACSAEAAGIYLMDRTAYAAMLRRDTERLRGAREGPQLRWSEEEPTMSIPRHAGQERCPLCAGLFTETRILGHYVVCRAEREQRAAEIPLPPNFNEKIRTMRPLTAAQRQQETVRAVLRVGLSEIQDVPAPAAEETVPSPTHEEFAARIREARKGTR